MFQGSQTQMTINATNNARMNGCRLCTPRVPDIPPATKGQSRGITVLENPLSSQRTYQDDWLPCVEHPWDPTILKARLPDNRKSTLDDFVSHLFIVLKVPNLREPTLRDQNRSSDSSIMYY